MGFRLAAEWEDHRATWLSWPRPDSPSYAEGYEAALEVLVRFVRLLVQGEEVRILVRNEGLEGQAQAALRQGRIPMHRVFFHRIPTYEPWCRDYGPVFLVRERISQRQVAVVDWRYNAWGGKYAPYEEDDAMPAHVARLRRQTLFTPKIVLEGGALEANGAGSLLTSEAAVLSAGRNPDLTAQEAERIFLDYLGVSNVLWLREGLDGDYAGGRVDNLARFVNPSTIVAAVEDDLEDGNYMALQENLRRLRTMRDQEEHLFRIVKLPLPGRLERAGRRLPASYLQFYIANSAVVVPTYGHSRDRVALESLQREFADRRVVGLDCRDLLRGGGSLHSLALPEPL